MYTNETSSDASSLVKDGNPMVVETLSFSGSVSSGKLMVAQPADKPTVNVNILPANHKEKCIYGRIQLNFEYFDALTSYDSQKLSVHGW